MVNHSRLLALFFILVMSQACTCNILITQEGFNELTTDSGDFIDAIIPDDKNDEPADRSYQETKPLPELTSPGLDTLSCLQLSKNWPSYLLERQGCTTRDDCNTIREITCGCNSGVAIRDQYRAEIIYYFYKLLECRMPIKECEKDHPPPKSLECRNGLCVATYRKECPLINP